MAAPLGFKTFTTGEVLTAADTNGYLMQGVMVFATAAARNAAITVPVEGNTCYLSDTDVIQVYSGSAWVTKSGSSPLTTKGDLYTYSTTDARLGVGTDGQVLTAASGQATGLQWATVSSGGMTLLSTTTLTGASVTVSSINQTYNSLYLVAYNVLNVSAGVAALRIAPNGSTSITSQVSVEMSGGSAGVNANNATYLFMSCASGSNKPRGNNATNAYALQINNYASTTAGKPIAAQGGYIDDFSGAYRAYNGAGSINTNSAITSLTISTDASINFSSGTLLIYGVK